MAIPQSVVNTLRKHAYNAKTRRKLSDEVTVSCEGVPSSFSAAGFRKLVREADEVSFRVTGTDNTGSSGKVDSEGFIALEKAFEVKDDSETRNVQTVS